MCLIINRPQGSNVPNDILAIHRTKNPDGFGISWRDDSGLHFEKYGPKDYEPFHSLLKRIDGNPNVEYTAHYRFATTGAPCKALSHPFVYDDPDPAVGPVHVFHNGIIPIEASKGESDTSQFVKSVIQKLPSRWWANSALVFLVESTIGYSRLLVMTKDETIRLDGGRSWTKRNGIWYSTEPKPYGSKPSQAVTKWSGGKGFTYMSLPAEPKADVSCSIDHGDADEEEVGWYHEGHWVESALKDNSTVFSGPDASGPAVCTECDSAGEFFIIDGTEFIEMEHQFADENEDEGALDAETMAAVYAQ